VAGYESAQLGRFDEAAPYATEVIWLAAPTQRAFIVGHAHFVASALTLKGEWAKARHGNRGGQIRE